MSIVIRMSVTKKLARIWLYMDIMGSLGVCGFAGIGGIATMEYK